MPDAAIMPGGQLVNLRHPDSTDAEYDRLAAAQALFREAELGQDDGTDLDKLPDYVLIQRQMRRLVAHSDNSIIQIQAGKLLSRLVDMRAEIPAHILYEETQSDVRQAMGDLDELADDELARQYRQLLG